MPVVFEPVNLYHPLHRSGLIKGLVTISGVLPQEWLYQDRSGCPLLVQVWVHAELDAAGRVHFAADSDSELTRGLAAVLVRALSGLTPEEVQQVAPRRSRWSAMLWVWL